MAETVYDIRVRYMLDDKASKKIGGIEKQARKAADKMSGLSKSARKTAGGTSTLSKSVREAAKGMRGLSGSTRKAAKGLPGLSKPVREAAKETSMLSKSVRRAAKGMKGLSGSTRKAAKGTSGLSKSVREAAKGTSALSRSLRRLAVGAVGFLSFRFGKKLLIDFNRELQESRIQMATLSKMSLGGDWARNQERANFLIRKFQKDAAKGVGTTQDYIKFSADIAKPFLDAGGSMKELTTLTRVGVTAAKTFGIENAVAARDIQQMLLGTVRSVDRLPRLLGLTAATWNSMVRQKGPEETLKKLMEALDNPSIRKAAEVYGRSWSGVADTLKDNLQRAFGKVGLPLMKAITKEMQKLSAWFEANPKKVNRIIQSIGKGLITAFKVVKTVFGLIFKHRKLLMALIAFKLVSKGVGGMVGIFAKLGGGADAAGASLFGFQKGMKGVMGGLGRATVILAGVYVAASAVAEQVDKAQERQLKKQMDIAGIKGKALFLGGAGFQTAGERRGVLAESRRRGIAPGMAAAEDLLRQLPHTGLVGKKGEIRFGKFLDATGATGLLGGRARGKAKQMQKKAGRALGPGELITVLEEINRQRFKQQIQFLRGIERAQKLQVAQQTANQLKGMLAAKEQFNMVLAQTGGNVDKAVAAISGSQNRFLVLWLKAQAMSNGSLMDSLKLFAKDAVKAVTTEVPKASADGDVSGDRKSKVVKPKSVTNIGKISVEVVSDDPDRFAFNLIGAFEDRRKSPTQAAKAIAEGR